MDNLTPVGDLSYEQARDELRGIIQSLEAGSAPLDETLALWRRGEELSRRCRQILQGAQRAIAEANETDTASAENSLQS